MEERSYTSDKEELEKFLLNVRTTICDSAFNPYANMIIIPKKKSEGSLDRFTTENTMMRLEFDPSDVANELKTLTHQEYYQTCIDDLDKSLPNLFVFFRKIQNEDIYIKFRIYTSGKERVLCLSFHRAREPVDYEALPYRHCTW